MKKLFFIIGLFFSLSAMAQPTNYTKINMRYRWLSGMFDSALYVPRYNGTPSGVRVNETSVFDGMVAMDTTNNRLYIYSGGAWVRLANYSEIAAYTAGNGLTLSGSQFELGGALSKQTSITGNYKLFLNNRHTHIQGDTVYFASNTNNLINLNSSGGLGDELLLEANGGAIRFTSVSDLYMPAPIFTGTVSSGASTDSILTVNTLTGEVRKRQLSEVVTTPTLQQVLTAGSTLTTNADINAGQNSVTIDSVSYLKIANGYSDSGSPGLHGDFLQLNLIAVDILQLVGGSSSIQIRDSIKLSPQLGQLNIDSLRTWSDITDTTYKKPMTFDTRNGRWEYAANWYAPVTESNSVTLTNKRWTARVGSTTSSATPTINTDLYDIYKLTAQAADITSFTTNLSGTPNDGDILEIQITGTAARAITWGSSFVSTTVTLPTTTTSTNTLTVILQYYTTSSYGNNKWHCVNYY